MAKEKSGLDLLREPFPPHQISKLPKPTKAQTEAVKANFKAGVRCKECGAWHHPEVVHLDYVGHAALTDRLLSCDLAWSWEPLALGADGYPVIDRDGGIWIKLTVCGVTRLGYGDAQGKTGGDAMKERIGDALRNAAMRFGAALDLWHKGDLHKEEDIAATGLADSSQNEATQPRRPVTEEPPKPLPPEFISPTEVETELRGSFNLGELADIFKSRWPMMQAHYSKAEIDRIKAVKDELKAAFER